jgi:Arc/MetJ family transcription regulator
MHIEIDDDLVAKVDEIPGTRGRSAFVRSAIEQAVRDAHHRSDLDAAGSIADHGHEWDADPADWVRQQRRSAASRRAG